jgi:hypothetical protein
MILLGPLVEAILRATDKSQRLKTTTTPTSKYSRDSKLNNIVKQNQLTDKVRSELGLESDLSIAIFLDNPDYTRFSMTALVEGAIMAAIFKIRITRACTLKNLTQATVKQYHVTRAVSEVRAETTITHLKEVQ